MKRIIQALLCLCLYTSAGAQMITVSGSNLTDSSNAAVSNATITFAPVLPSGQATSYRKGTAGGQVIVKPVSAAVTSGAFSISVADTSLTNPANICYAVTVTDNVTGANLLGGGYGCVQPTTSASWCSSVCNFDAYPPDLSPMLPVQAGPQGIQGVPGGPNTTATRLNAVNMNTLTQCGTYDGSSMVNGPSAFGSNFFHWQVICTDDPTFATQIAFDMIGGTNTFYVRNETYGTWGAWQVGGPAGMWSTTGIINTVQMQVATATTSTCTASLTAFTAGSTCMVTVPLPVTEPDTNYREVCTAQGDFVAVGQVATPTTTSIPVNVFGTLTGVHVGATITCLVIHN
jgi:hypothetical protein